MTPHLQLMTGGPIGVHANQALSKWSWSNYSLDETERAEIDSWFIDNAAFTKGAPGMDHLQGILAGHDVYLIIVESLEEVVVGLEVEGQEVTPNMNAMLEESVAFNQVLEQTRDGNTADAELMILTGQYPTLSGAAFLKHARNHFPVTLPHMLRAEGFSTGAIHGDIASFWNREVVFANIGFDEYISEEDFLDAPEIGMGIADAALFRQSLIEAERMIGPQFLMITTLTSHFPYNMPPRLKGLELKTEDSTADYLQTIHYVDDQIGEFVETLEAGKARPSAFVIVGDHEGIHRYSTDTWLSDNNGRLPFFVHVPGMDGMKIENPGGQIDILPTLAYLMGIPEEMYAGRIMGRNLLGSQSGSSIDSDGDPIGSPTRVDLLKNAYDISDLALRGDYFAPE